MRHATNKKGCYNDDIIFSFEVCTEIIEVKKNHFCYSFTLLHSESVKKIKILLNIKHSLSALGFPNIYVPSGPGCPLALGCIYSTKRVACLRCGYFEPGTTLGVPDTCVPSGPGWPRYTPRH